MSGRGSLYPKYCLVPHEAREFLGDSLETLIDMLARAGAHVKLSVHQWHYLRFLCARCAPVRSIQAPNAEDAEIRGGKTAFHRQRVFYQHRGPIT